MTTAIEVSEELIQKSDRKFAIIPVGFSTPIGDALPIVVERIVLTLNPEKIVLFGSYAWGTPSPDSDVDLLVIMQTDQSSSERYLEVSRLLRPRPFPVDILVKTPAEIENALNSNDFFIQDILTQGQVLYERN